MLARTSTIRHKESGVSLETPLLVPSFSSKGFRPSKAGENSEIEQVLRAAGEFITDCYLVSAYDIYYENLPKPEDLPFQPELMFLDSGGYEVSDAYDLSGVYHSAAPAKSSWSIDFLNSVLDQWPKEMPTVFVSYDHPNERKNFLDQVETARNLFKGRQNQLNTLLIKPETQTQLTLREALRATIANVEELGSFDSVGVTEKELGASMLDRMVQIAKLRRALDEAHIKIPIHIFGALDPLSVCLYYLSGAEIFDGLTWIRYAYADGQCVYTHNHGALSYGLHTKDNLCKSKAMADNCYYLQGLQNRLRDFESTRSFEKLEPHSKFLKNAYDSLNTRLRGDK